MKNQAKSPAISLTAGGQPIYQATDFLNSDKIPNNSFEDAAGKAYANSSSVDQVFGSNGLQKLEQILRAAGMK